MCRPWVPLGSATAVIIDFLSQLLTMYGVAPHSCQAAHCKCGRQEVASSITEHTLTPPPYAHTSKRGPHKSVLSVYVTCSSKDAFCLAQQPMSVSARRPQGPVENFHSGIWCGCTSRTVQSRALPGEAPHSVHANALFSIQSQRLGLRKQSLCQSAAWRAWHTTDRHFPIPHQASHETASEAG